MIVVILILIIMIIMIIIIVITMMIMIIMNRDSLAQRGLSRASSYLCTVGFHNFNLRIFNLRVSNPNKFIVDVFF